jgi:GNAT superfamily N-acetyltransferase
VSASITVEPVASRRDLAEFIRLPWTLYADAPSWVPPLRASVRELLDEERHPFYAGGEAARRALLIARDRSGTVVGRIAAIVNLAHNRFHDDRLGFVGFFECADSLEAGRALLDSACDWLERQGCSGARGPVSPSTNYECGLLVDGFDRPPALMMPYNKPYMEQLFLGSGWSPAKDLYAYESAVHDGSVERLQRFAERARRREPGLTTRGANLSQFTDEVRLVQSIYNSAWERNWGFVPMSDAEIEHMAKELKQLVEPSLLRFGFINDEPAGFLLAVPDWNPALRQLDGSPWRHPLRTLRLLVTASPRKMHGLRLITLGVKEQFRRRGVEGLLFAEGLQAALEIGYQRCEYSWILDDNELTKRTVRLMDAELTKTYRLYERHDL